MIARVTPVKEELVKDIRASLWMLFGAGAFLLAIACANVAGLLLARGAARQRELALRAALGAGRGRIVGQLLTESLLLALAGGVFGLLVAAVCLHVIAAMPGLELPRVDEIRLDGTMLGFAAALSAATSLLFGLAPSLGASRPNLVEAMKGGTGAGASASHSSRWFTPRGAVVVAQVALCIVLLIGAALLLESLSRLRRVDPGFRAANLLTMQITVPRLRQAELVQRVESIPGVRSAAITLTLPMTGWAGLPVHPVGQPLIKLNERPIAILQSVTPGYFRTLGVSLRRGSAVGGRDQ